MISKLKISCHVQSDSWTALVTLKRVLYDFLGDIHMYQSEERLVLLTHETTVQRTVPVISSLTLNSLHLCDIMDLKRLVREGRCHAFALMHATII